MPKQNRIRIKIDSTDLRVRLTLRPGGVARWLRRLCSRGLLVVALAAAAFGPHPMGDLLAAPPSSACEAQVVVDGASEPSVAVGGHAVQPISDRTGR